MTLHMKWFFADYAPYCPNEGHAIVDQDGFVVFKSHDLTEDVARHIVQLHNASLEKNTND